MDGRMDLDDESGNSSAGRIPAWAPWAVQWLDQLDAALAQLSESTFTAASEHCDRHAEAQFHRLAGLATSIGYVHPGMAWCMPFLHGDDHGDYEMASLGSPGRGERNTGGNNNGSGSGSGSGSRSGSVSGNRVQ